MALLPLSIQTLVQKAALTARVDTALLCAMVSVESSGRPFCTKYEPASGGNVTDAAKWAQRTAVSKDTETAGQMTSWGLMQVMGFSARELGFSGLLPELCQPELGVSFGIYKLKHLETMFAGSASVVLTWNEAVVSAYNHGHPERAKDGSWVNQAYVDRVRAAYLAFGGKP